MQINRFKKLKGYRIFKDFVWPAELQGFARYNLIYGWNGSGKTSISSLLRNCQTHTVPDGDVEIEVDGKPARSADFKTYAFPSIRVFNRDFVDRNVFEDPSSELPPVFVLGEDSQAKQLELDKLLADEKSLNDALNAFASSEEKATVALNRFCTDQARSIRNLLVRDPRYSTYEAPRFKEAVRSISELNPRPERLSAEQRAELESTSNSSTLEKLDAAPYPDLKLKDLTIEVSNLLRRNPVGRMLDALVDNAPLSSWVERGLHLHGGATQCKFCEGALTPERLTILQGHFNGELDMLQRQLNVLDEYVEHAIKMIRQWNPPQKSQFYQHLQLEYGAIVATAGLHSTMLLDYLGRLKLGLEAKLGSPYTPLNLEDFHVPAEMVGKYSDASVGDLALDLHMEAALSGAGSIYNIKLAIDKHNNLTDNFAEEVKASRAALERDEVLGAFDDWENLQRAVDVLAQERRETREKIDSLYEPIQTLRRSILQHMTPADELNRDMTSYLGRSELTFEVKDTGYLIRRGGQPAMHLSDGERTAIAFMYFLKSLTDNSFDLPNGIVVIDDPVSSLDANSLYCAFGFMKDRAVNAGQLFVLTHNFAFFRQVKNWFNHLGKHKKGEPKNGPKVQFYMLSSKYVGPERHAHIQKLDPLLHEHESEYHYLFQQVRAGSAEAAPQNLEAVYGTPNIARRLLESFVAFRAPRAGTLDSRIQSLEGSAAAKARIIRFLHTHSHADNISEPEHDLSLLSETPAVLVELLGFIRLNDEKHYDAMLALTEPEELAP